MRQSALEKVWSRERVGYIQYIFLSFKRGLDLDSGIKLGSPRPGLDSDGRVGRMWLLRASSSLPITLDVFPGGAAQLNI